MGILPVFISDGKPSRQSICDGKVGLTMIIDS